MPSMFPDLTRDLPEINWKDLFSARKDVPPLEPEKLLEAHRKNLEAWAAAQRVLTQGFQTITKRQAEIMRDNMTEASGILRTMVGPGSFSPEKQAEQLKIALEAQRAYLREVTELMGKIQTDAYNIIRDRFMEGMDEIRDGKKPAPKPKAEPVKQAAAEKTASKPKPKTAPPKAAAKKKPAAKKR